MRIVNYQIYTNRDKPRLWRLYDSKSDGNFMRTLYLTLKKVKTIVGYVYKAA